MKLRSLSASVLAACLAPLSPAQTFLGPDPYFSAADSPFDLSGLGSTAFLEDFEDGTLNIPGTHADVGAVYGPGGLTDSVDGDDGVIDGSGTNGHSFFSGNGPAGIRFTFSKDELGALPTFAGVVWTDGAGGCSITFEAFNKNGVSLGTVHQDNLGDNSNSGTTAEDRFCGVKFNGGISAIRMSNDSGGIEIDHVQYGGVPDQCYADCTDDGVLDLFDFLCFVNDFNAGNGYSNCDNNNAHDLFDFLCFVNAFNSGCP